MPDHELVGLLADEQLDVDAALGGRGDGVQQRLVRDEVRDWSARAAAWRRVDQRGEQPQVVLARRSPGRSGTTWHATSCSSVADRPSVGGVERSRRSSDLAGLGVPVGGEDRVERRDDRALRAAPSARPTRARPCGSSACCSRGSVRFCEPDEADPAVDHEDLAVVAQVGAAELALQRRIGSIGCHWILVAAQPRRACPCSPGMPREPRWSKRNRTVTPRSAARDHRVEERRGHVVPRGDVELDVHVVARPSSTASAMCGDRARRSPASSSTALPVTSGSEPSVRLSRTTDPTYAGRSPRSRGRSGTRRCAASTRSLTAAAARGACARRLALPKKQERDEPDERARAAGSAATPSRSTACGCRGSRRGPAPSCPG